MVHAPKNFKLLGLMKRISKQKFCNLMIITFLGVPHSEEQNDLYSSPTIVWVIKSKRMRWAGHVARRGNGRGVYRVLVGKTKGKNPLGRPRCGWEDIIKADLQKTGCRGIDWVELAQDRDRWRALVNAVMNLLIS
jgi:ribosomal protein L35AE/L33A